jgi:hypothetical protein
VVDTKKTTSGATFTSDILEKIPTARDPWQIINMTPGVQAGLNVGGSSSGQQVGLTSRGTTASVQWNLEGGAITDLSSNSSPTYFNFDSFDQISVTNGGGDVSVQSSGLSINLVTKSGSNVFKGSAVGTFQNDKMQANNVTEEQFLLGTGGFLSGAPMKKIYNISGEYGGPIIRNRLWWWAAADKQAINAGVVNFFDRARPNCVQYADAQRAGTLLSGGSLTYDNLEEVQDCLSNDQTIIKNKQAKLNFQLNASHKFQYQFSSDNKFRNARGASANTEKEAVTVQSSEFYYWDQFPLPTRVVRRTSWVPKPEQNGWVERSRRPRPKSKPMASTTSRENSSCASAGKRFVTMRRSGRRFDWAMRRTSGMVTSRISSKSGSRRLTVASGSNSSSHAS